MKEKGSEKPYVMRKVEAVVPVSNGIKLSLCHEQVSEEYKKLIYPSADCKAFEIVEQFGSEVLRFNISRDGAVDHDSLVC